MPDSIQYDPAAECLFEGTVATTRHVLQGVVYFRLKTSDAMFEVELGPRGFVEKSGFRLKAGEMVSVIGAPAMRQARKVLLARQVTHAGGTFVLRDRNGEPMWDPNRRIQMDPELPNLCRVTK
jgi:hypothetical protein